MKTRATGVVLGFLAACQPALTQNAERFLPEALKQDGKVTLTPAFSPDGSTLYFAQSECSPIWKCPQRLKISKLGPQGWSAPKLINLPGDYRVDWPNVSPDGRTLYFSWAAPRAKYKDLDIDINFDLYTLDLTRVNATPVPISGSDINRPRSGKVRTLRYVHNEAQASLTVQGDLYFMTERLDGPGERDIYVARSDGKDGFETAMPLPPPINSKLRDGGAWVNPEGSLMLLSYPERGGYGGEDIFISRKTGDVWSMPVNLGAGVNTKYSEFGARLTPDGSKIVFTSDRPFEGQARGLLQVWVANMPDVK